MRNINCQINIWAHNMHGIVLYAYKLVCIGHAWHGMTWHRMHIHTYMHAHLTKQHWTTLTRRQSSLWISWQWTSSKIKRHLKWRDWNKSKIYFMRCCNERVLFLFSLEIGNERTNEVTGEKQDQLKCVPNTNKRTRGERSFFHHSSIHSFCSKIKLNGHTPKRTKRANELNVYFVH